MNVLHVITTLELGGAEKQLEILTFEQVRNGHKVSVVYLKGKSALASTMNAYGVRVLDDLANKSFFSQISEFRKILQQNNFGVIHSHLPRAEILVYLSHPKEIFVVSRHNSEKFWPSMPSILSSFLSRKITNRANGIIAISLQVKKFLIEKHEVSKNSFVKVIHYGFDPRIETSGNKKRIRSSGEGVVFGTLSRLTPQKDLRTMIKGFSLFNKAFPNSTLNIGGEGDQITELRYQVQQLQIQGSVDFLGKIEDTITFLNYIDIFLLTSVYEGFGLVLLEAMSQAKPIIASDIEIMREVLGETGGLFFKKGDSEDLAKKMFDLVIQMGVSTGSTLDPLNRIKQFSSPKMFENIIEFYREIGAKI